MPDTAPSGRTNRASACSGAAEAVNARTNTCTTGAGSGIGIYWLNGSKVADSYSDLYDGSWDNGGSGKNEHGNPRSATYRLDRNEQ